MTIRNLLLSHINSYVSQRTKQLEELKLTASFVIPVYNSAESLDLCIAAVFKQTRRDLINEVVLIDDASSDNSRQIMQRIAREYLGLLPIKIILLNTRKHAAHARNRGIEASSGDLVCFVDSDIIVPPGYLAEHAHAHELNSPAITFSLRHNIALDEIDEVNFPVLAPDDFRYPVVQTNRLLQGSSYHLESNHELADLCLTCAVTYRRADLNYVMGCPENFKGWGYNDTAMASKVIARGRSVIPILQGTVCHIIHDPRSGNEQLKKHERESNKRRYERMKDMLLKDTCKHYIPELEEVSR